MTDLSVVPDTLTMLRRQVDLDYRPSDRAAMLATIGRYEAFWGHVDLRLDREFFARADRLAVINTAIAFTLWNYTLRTLSAMESSIINNTMLFQIAVLAWLFLDEPLGWREVLGMALATLGTLLVQIRRRPSL